MNSLNEPSLSQFKSKEDYLLARIEWLNRNKPIEQQVNKIYPDIPQKSQRQLLLEDAIEITTRDRNTSYGNPEDNFRNIANLWTAIHTGKHGFIPATQFNSADVALFCIAIKLARLATNQTHRDSALDIAGYAACLADIQYSMNQQPTRSNDENVDFDPTRSR